MLFTLDRVKIKRMSASVGTGHLPTLPWPPKILCQFSWTCQNYDSMCIRGVPARGVCVSVKVLNKWILTEAFNSRVKKRNGPGRYKM